LERDAMLLSIGTSHTGSRKLPRREPHTLNPLYPLKRYQQHPSRPTYRKPIPTRRYRTPHRHPRLQPKPRKNRSGNHHHARNGTGFGKPNNALILSESIQLPNARKIGAREKGEVKIARPRPFLGVPAGYPGLFGADLQGLPRPRCAGPRAARGPDRAGLGCEAFAATTLRPTCDMRAWMAALETTAAQALLAFSTVVGNAGGNIYRHLRRLRLRAGPSPNANSQATTALPHGPWPRRAALSRDWPAHFMAAVGDTRCAADGRPISARALAEA
jgi:hypothetical protein